MIMPNVLYLVADEYAASFHTPNIERSRSDKYSNQMDRMKKERFK